jgi:hypothetical protein
MPATARVITLMTPDDKASLDRKARDAGTSAAELVRRAISAYDPHDEPEIQKLKELTEELRLSADAVEASVDRALASYAAMRKQLDQRHAG